MGTGDVTALKAPCEHGMYDSHFVPIPGTQWSSPEGDCPGGVRLDPKQLEERIAETICRIDNETGPDVAVEGIPCALHRSVARSVLDALNIYQEVQ